MDTSVEQKVVRDEVVTEILPVPVLPSKKAKQRKAAVEDPVDLDMQQMLTRNFFFLHVGMFC